MPMFNGVPEEIIQMSYMLQIDPVLVYEIIKGK